MHHKYNKYFWSTVILDGMEWNGMGRNFQRYQGWMPKGEKSYQSARKKLIKKTILYFFPRRPHHKWFSSIFLLVHCKEWWRNPACFLQLCKAPDINSESIGCKCPYLHSLNIQMNVDANLQMAQINTFLSLSGLKIRNPKGRKDFLWL